MTFDISGDTAVFQKVVLEKPVTLLGKEYLAITQILNQNQVLDLLRC